MRHQHSQKGNMRIMKYGHLSFAKHVERSFNILKLKAITIFASIVTLLIVIVMYCVYYHTSISMYFTDDNHPYHKRKDIKGALPYKFSDESLSIYRRNRFTYNGLRRSYSIPNENEIDVVISWLNSSDPKWLQRYQQYATNLKLGSDADRKELSNRLIGSIEIHLNLISLSVFAPWVRHIYILSNQKLDYYNFLPINFANKIKFVEDDSILPQEHIPSFHSDAIESFIYKIPGLSELYIYMNDDMMYTKPAHVEQFLNIKTKMLYIPSYYNKRICREYKKDAALDHSQVYYNTAKLFALNFGKCYPFTAHGHFPYYQLKSANKEVVRLYNKSLTTMASQKFRPIFHSPTGNVSYHTLENNGSFNSLYLSNYISAYRKKSVFVTGKTRIAMVSNCSSIVGVFRNDSIYDTVNLQELHRCKNISGICDDIVRLIYLHVPITTPDRQINFEKALSLCASCKPFNCVYKPSIDILKHKKT